MNEFSITFLGTAAASIDPRTPTACCLVKVDDTRIMIDAGIGVLRQLRLISIDSADIDIVLITHWHLDHFLGLPALLRSKKRELPLRIYGPRPPLPALIYLAGLLSAAHVSFEPVTEHFSRSFFTSSAGESSAPERLKVFPPGQISSCIHIDAIPTVHDINSFGWVISEKEPKEGPPRKLVFSGDTHPVPDILNASRGADLLIHEATFRDRQERRAHAREHSTPVQAASLACEAGAGALALVHIPARNVSPGALKEARAIFPGLFVPSVLEKISISPVSPGAKDERIGWASLTVEPRDT